MATLVNLLRDVIFVANINMPLQVTTNILLRHISQVIFMELIFVTLMEKCMLYVLTFSFFIWKRPLPDMQSDTVILGLKTIFSESGSPEILITDNGRSFISEDFKQFAVEWSFVHKTSSPRYPKGNIHSERAVGIVKEVYTKCKDDFLLGLLVHHTTPLLHMKTKLSSAELFFSFQSTYHT